MLNLYLSIEAYGIMTLYRREATTNYPIKKHMFFPCIWQSPWDPISSVSGFQRKDCCFSETALRLSYMVNLDANSA